MSRIQRQSYLEATFGKPEQIEKILKSVVVPNNIPLVFGNGISIKRVSVHPLISVQLDYVFGRLSREIDPAALASIGFYEYGGSFVNRPMRGGTTPSAHAYGIALDFATSRNGLNQSFSQSSFSSSVGKLVCKIFAAGGFINYGEILGYDAMHFEYIGPFRP